MDHFEALQNAVGLLTMEAPLRRATLGNEEPTTRKDTIAALNDLVEMFRPYDGDDTNSPPRVPHPCTCSNCGLTFTRFWLPADANRVALMALRGAFCPRCYATKGIGIEWDAKKLQPAMSFSANIVEASNAHSPVSTPSVELKLVAFGNPEQIKAAMDAVSSGELVTVTTMPGSQKP